MELIITKENFVNNMFRQITEGGCVAVFNSVQEHWRHSGEDFIVDAINIQVYQEREGNRFYLPCPSIIGMENEMLSIQSSYPELQGQPITLDNIDKCVIVISDKQLVE